jgi:hypothetical protein
MGNQKLKSPDRYFAALITRFATLRQLPWLLCVYPRVFRSRVFCLRLASARRSVFFRRLARFLALSRPLLFPIIPNTLPLTSNIKSASRTDSSCGEHQNSSVTLTLFT